MGRDMRSPDGRRVLVVRLVVVTLALALLLPAARTGRAQDTADTTLRFALTWDDTNLTPYTYLVYQNLTLVWDTLFWHDTDNRIVPWMVESHEVSEDGTRWDLTLHEGLRWHDGEPVTADDVKFTFEYVATHEHGRWTGEVDNVASVDSDGDRQVTITLNEPSATFVFQPLADLPIMPQHVFAGVDNPKEFTEELPVGSGPFRMVEMRPGEFYRFEAVDDYFRGRPAVDVLEAPIINEASAMFLALEAGDVHATYRPVPPGQISEFQSDEYEIAQGPGFGTFRLLFNLERPGVDQREVRQAVALAVDEQELVDTVLAGFGIPGNPGFVHPASPWANPELEAEHDPEAARQLLDDSGIVDSDGDGIREAEGTPLSFEVLVYATEPDRIRSAELMAEMVREVGVEFVVQSLEAETVDERVDEGDYQLAILWLTPPFQTDPDSLRRLFASDGDLNRVGYANSEFDALAATQARQVDEQARRQTVFEMQEILARDVPTLVYYHSDLLYPYRPVAIDEWAFTSGIGIYDRTALLESIPAAAEPDPAPSPADTAAEPTDAASPAAAPDSDDDGGTSTGVVLVLALLVLGGAGGVVVWRRARASVGE